MAKIYHVGERVIIPFGRGKVPAVVTEDRGAIGVGGRRLYQVRTYLDPFDPTIFEIPEEEIEAPDQLTRGQTKLDKKKAMEYLINGGLIAILRANSSGGRDQPRAWLCLDSLGNVTHTFVEECGVLGGWTVPFWATHGDKVLTPRRDEVLSFLQSFDLDRREAEKVLRAVGTAP